MNFSFEINMKLGLSYKLITIFPFPIYIGTECYKRGGAPDAQIGRDAQVGRLYVTETLIVFLC